MTRRAARPPRRIQRGTIDFRLIRQLWMFLAVAEEQHFGRAAPRLRISQPPLTEQIKVLEHALKLQSFERSRRGTTLSPAGTALLPGVPQFAEQVERLESVIREIAAGQSGVLHIGAMTSAMRARAADIRNLTLPGQVSRLGTRALLSLEPAVPALI